MDIDRELPLNAAHCLERKAEILKNQCRYEDARQAYLKASEAMNNAFVFQKCLSADIPIMLEWQRNYFNDQAKIMDKLFKKQKSAENSFKDSIQPVPQNLSKEDTNDYNYEDTSRTEAMHTERLDSLITALKQKGEFSKLARVHESDDVDLKKQNKMLEKQFEGMLRTIVNLRRENMKLKEQNETLTKNFTNACELNFAEPTLSENSQSLENQISSIEPDTIKSLENLLLDAIDD